MKNKSGAVCLSALLAMTVTVALAAPSALVLPPHLGPAGRDDFASYLVSANHKAFVVAPGGGWAWVADETTAALAQEKALARCRSHTDQTCVPYAQGERRVFDDKRWVTLWRLPAAPAASESRSTGGLTRGATFPDLNFASAAGNAKRLSDWRGQVVVLHFWGSWCGPCRHELPDMAAQAKAFNGKGVSFIPLQVRESFADARRWISQQGIALTLYDSGIRSGNDGDFRVDGGGRLPDRAVAPVFPSTVVLDQAGRVVFTHHGPIERWAEYAAFLQELARR